MRKVREPSEVTQPIKENFCEWLHSNNLSLDEGIMMLRDVIKEEWDDRDHQLAYLEVMDKLRAAI